MSRGNRSRCALARPTLASVLVSFVAACLASCQPTRGPLPTNASMEELARGAQRDGGERLGRRLLRELVAEGGDAEQARRLSEALEAAEPSSFTANFALGLEHHWHGQQETATRRFVAALSAVQGESDPRQRLLSWFAAERAARSRGSAPQLWRQLRPQVEAILEAPGGIGFRGHGALAGWWLAQEAPGDPELARQQFGCVTEVRLAGPFGSAAPVHLQRSFPPERPGPWPQVWAQDPLTGYRPRQRETRQEGCAVSAVGGPPQGVYYAETFLELAEAQELLLAIRGSLAVWVDDTLVLDRATPRFGQWPRFGIRLGLSAGRHRVLARLADPAVIVRVLGSDGRPRAVRASRDAAPLYRRLPPHVLEDPNDLMRFIGDATVRAPEDPVLAIAAAELCHVEGQDDLASLMMAPVTRDRLRAAGPTLAHWAEVAARDPLLTQALQKQQTRQLHAAAAERDPRLWGSRLMLILAEASEKGLPETAARLGSLWKAFPQQARVGLALANVYGQLGWEPEYERLMVVLAERFVEHPGVLSAAVGALEAKGDVEAAGRALSTLRALQPRSELFLERALAQQRFDEALAELERLQSLSPHSTRYAKQRLQLQRSRGQGESQRELLTQAVREEPEDAKARLALADFELSGGKPGALQEAIAQAAQDGVPTARLERALDSLNLRTAFAPYRLSSAEVIRQYEQGGRHQPASAARVLDYGVLWVLADGSSRLLEHEIVRMQSDEGVAAWAEHRQLGGLVLNLRVIKQDGRMLEPEVVEGKPTVTMPHLEVGDYVETEHLVSFPAQARGLYYEGPRWFFREEKVAYARSEFIVVSPSARPLALELTGAVPEPTVERDGQFVIRRYRVDDSPAAPDEPMSPPVAEFLPSVRVGWGDPLGRRLGVLAAQVADADPLDPRIVELAREVVGDAVAPGEQARRAYRWVQDQVQDGREGDARRALHAREGNRWAALRMLLRALAIPAEQVIASSRLAPQGGGPRAMAESFAHPLLEVQLPSGPVYTTLSERLAPFGYVPAPLRGAPGYRLSVDQPLAMTIPQAGGADRLEYEVTGELGSDRSPQVRLVQRYVGKYAARLRAGLARVSELSLAQLVEQRLLGQAFPGAQLVRFEIVNREDLEQPLEVVIVGNVEELTSSRPGGAVLVPPLVPRIGSLAALPERRTPWLLREAMHQQVRLQLKVPTGAQVRGLQRYERHFDGVRVRANDRLEGGTLVVEREVELPAGRISVEEYPKFRKFLEEQQGALAAPLWIDTRPVRRLARGAAGAR